jgi:hypothetical protein
MTPAAPVHASATPWLTPRRLSQIELLGIPLLVVSGWASLPACWLWEPQLRWLFGYAAAALLGQGLLRDLARLVVRRGAALETRRLTCLCAESGLGLTLLLVGAGGLTALGVTQTVTLDPNRLALGLSGLLGLGFLAKDYVLVLQRVEDHATLRVW